jgi:hypothetical protein
MVYCYIFLLLFINVSTNIPIRFYTIFHKINLVIINIQNNIIITSVPNNLQLNDYYNFLF